MLTRSRTFFAVGGVIFRVIHKKIRKELVPAIQAIKYKIMWLENILAHAHLWRGSTQIEYSSQRMTQQV